MTARRRRLRKGTARGSSRPPIDPGGGRGDARRPAHRRRRPDVLASDRVSRRPDGSAVSRAERAPGLLQSLRAERIVILSAPADLEAEVRAGRLDVGLVIPDDYAARLAPCGRRRSGSSRIRRAAPRAMRPDACATLCRATLARWRPFG